MALFKLKKKLVLALDGALKDDKVLKLIAPLPDIEKCRRVLFVGPHPDDIEIGAGASVNKFVREGKDVAMLVCTDGGAGIEDASYTPEKIAAIRLEESKQAAKSLGVKSIDNLGFPDGGRYDEWDLAIEIAKKIYEFSPDAIICPDPNLPSETHPDHLKCARATCDALFISSYYFVAQRNGLTLDPKKIKHSHVLAYYYTARANSYVALEEQDTMARLKAIKLHASQMPGGAAEGISLYLSLRDKHMGEECGVKEAEGFFVMAPMHQHCVSETNNW